MTGDGPRPHWLAGMLLAWGAALALPACSAAPGNGGGKGVNGPTGGTGTSPAATQRTEAQPAQAGGCNLQAVQDLLGQRGTEALTEQARQRSGARRARMYGPGDMVTRDYDLQRLNLELDDTGRVARIFCG